MLQRLNRYRIKWFRSFSIYSPKSNTLQPECILYYKYMQHYLYWYWFNIDNIRLTVVRKKCSQTLRFRSQLSRQSHKLSYSLYQTQNFHGISFSFYPNRFAPQFYVIISHAWRQILCIHVSKIFINKTRFDFQSYNRSCQMCSNTCYLVLIL